jgi:hypothetical protein
MLDDLEVLGVSRESVARRVPSPTMAALIGPRYYWILNVHPVVLLGYLEVLEGEPPVAERLEEAIDDRKTVELELMIPKSEDVLKQFSKIQIWFDQSGWLPVQQQLFESGSGDYMIVRYSKMVRNPNIPDSAFKPRWPKGTEKIKH